MLTQLDPGAVQRLDTRGDPLLDQLHAHGGMITK
jgi:hypothetical protein